MSEHKDKCRCEEKPCCDGCAAAERKWVGHDQKKESCCDVDVTVDVVVKCSCGREHRIKK